MTAGLGWPGKGGPVVLFGGPRWNRLERAAWVMELRRLRGLASPLPPPLLLLLEPSADIMILVVRYRLWLGAVGRREAKSVAREVFNDVLVWR